MPLFNYYKSYSKTIWAANPFILLVGSKLNDNSSFCENVLPLLNVNVSGVPADIVSVTVVAAVALLLRWRPATVDPPDDWGHNVIEINLPSAAAGVIDK